MRGVAFIACVISGIFTPVGRVKIYSVSRFHLRAHNLKVVAAAGLEGSSRVCDECLGEDNMSETRCTLLFCQDQRKTILRRQ